MTDPRTDARPPKKSDTLEVRMPHETKRAFLEACRKDGRTASEVVRDFVDGYLTRRASGQVLQPLRGPSNTARNLAMSLFTAKGRRRALAAGVGALGLLALGVSPSVAEIDFRAMFDRLDADSDGRVTLGEFTAQPGGDGDVMVFRVERTQEIDGNAEVGVTEHAQTFWLPAPPMGAAAPPAGRDHQVRIVRRVENGEVVTEDVEELPPEFANLRAREFSMFDDNGDGAVDYAEFESRNRAILESTFARIDADGSGALSAEELNAAPALIFLDVAGADAPEPALPRPYDEAAFASLDRDRDGGVSLDEFAAGPAAP